MASIITFKSPVNDLTLIPSAPYGPSHTGHNDFTIGLEDAYHTFFLWIHHNADADHSEPPEFFLCNAYSSALISIQFGS